MLKALDVDPKFSEAHFQLALICQKDGANKEAEIHFQEAMTSANQQSYEIEKHGEELLKIFQFQKANVLFMKAQGIKYHCARVNFQLSNYYEDLNKSGKAKTCLKNSIKLNPTFSKAHRNLGILLYNQKSYDVAQLHIEKALDLDYSDCRSHLFMGMIMKQNKDYADAELHFLSALDINPKFIICLLEMANLQLITNNKKEARKYYHKARGISPNIKHIELDKLLE